MIKPHQTAILPNGLRLIHLPTDSPVCYCGFAVQAGTRDELPGEFGMAHFVEHLLFKGTEKRKAWHILNRMERVGGELNAYTSKEETFVYCSMMKQDVPRAIELLCDLVCHSTFPAHEMERELDVVLDEINSYKDNPSELIFDEFENYLFPSHALGHGILGVEEDLKQITSKKASTFFRKHYVPNKMVFFSGGDFPFNRIIKLLDRYFDTPRSANEVKIQTSLSPAPLFERVETPETYQTHVMIGSRAYDLFHHNRTALYLLNNILGGPGMNSRLNLALRERRGYVYSVESSITSYTDTGLFTIYFGCDERHLNKCIELVTKELKQLSLNPLNTLQLHQAKRQLIGQIGVGSDNWENMVLGMAKAFMHHNRYDTPAEVFSKIEALTTEQLLDAAQQVMLPEKQSRLIFKQSEE